MSKIFAAFLVVGAVGCGGNGSSANGQYIGHVNGSVGGAPLTSFSASVDTVISSLGLDAIEIGDEEQTCGDFSPLGTCHRPTLILDVVLTGVTSKTVPAGFTVPDAFNEAVYLLPSGGKSHATSGTIVVDTINPSYTNTVPIEVTGTFDLTFDTGDHITGSFDACNRFAACAGDTSNT